MAIPSYDDLARSIPDVSAGDRFGALADVLPRHAPGLPAARRASPAPAVSRGALFAAVHDDGGEANARLLAVARDFSPRVERQPGGTVVLDVAGLRRLLGEAPAIAADLARAGAPRVAIATSWIAATLLARAARGVTVAAGDPAMALARVPVSVLEAYLADADRRAAGPTAHRRRPTGAAARTQVFDAVRRWGLTTLGELASLPADDLAARAGAEGVAVQRLARGVDPRPLVPDAGSRRFLASFELEWPVDTLEPLSFVFARLLDPLAAGLERADRGAVAVHVHLRLTDRTIHDRTLQLPVAMRDPRVLRTLLLLDLESHPPPAAVDVVTLELDPAPSRIVQYSLLERATPSPETLATLMARLGALVGEARCGTPRRLDTHAPDAFALDPPAFGERGASAAEDRAAADEGEDAPRPALRRFRPPVAVRVEVDAGRPVRVAVDRRGMPGGLVRQAAGPWRTSGAWWAAERWNRDEWDVAFADGAVCRLFRDRDTGLWCLDGVFD